MNKSANATLDSIPTRKPERNARRAKAGGKPPAWKVKLKKQADEASQRFQGVCCTEPATTISDCINDQKSLDDFHGALNALSRKHTRGRDCMLWPKQKKDAERTIKVCKQTVDELFKHGPAKEEDWPKIQLARLLARGIHLAMIHRSDELGGFSHRLN